MTKKDSILLSIVGLATLVSVSVTYKLTIIQQTLGTLDFHQLSTQICGEEAPSFLWLFDLSSAPGLLFYAYMPMAAISLLFAIVLLQRRYKSQRTALLASALGIFVLWILCILAEWLASYHTVLLLSWQLIAILEVGLYIAAFSFAYVYALERDMPYWVKVVLGLIMVAVAGLTPTLYNIPSYNPRICAGTTDSLLWDVIYFIVEPALIVAAAGAGVSAFRTEKAKARRRHIALFTGSFVLFMTMFAVSNYFGELTTDYEMNFWGPLGLLVCFLMSGYMAMKRLRFHWHTVVAELLVWGLVTLIGTQFFYIEGTTPFLLNSAAFLITIVFGILMIRAATVEMQQKELEASLLRQREIVEHLLTSKAKEVLLPLRDNAPASALLARIGELQSAEGLKNKTVTLNMTSVDMKNAVLAAVAQHKEAAEKKGLTIVTDIADANYPVLSDSLWLSRLLNIYVDNAVRYTATGTITVGLKREGGNALFWVKDTGVGIVDDDKELLFTEGGRGKAAATINPDSMGFGLFTARLIADAYSGHTWVESTVGKGSTFYVELPLLA